MEMLECQMPGVGAWALELIAGGGGGFSQVVFTNPMEIVKVRLQTQAKDVKQKNSWDVIKELGVRGLYNGSAVTMARDIPSSAIFFAIYTLIRQVYPDQSFVAGFMAAIPATVLVTPFDVVKTRLQVNAPVLNTCGRIFDNTLSAHRVVELVRLNIRRISEIKHKSRRSFPNLHSYFETQGTSAENLSLISSTCS